MSQQNSTIQGLDSLQLISWINRQELTERQKQTICKAINTTGCTGNTLSQATVPEEIKEELQITTLLSRQLYSLIFANSPSNQEEKKHYINTQVNVPKLDTYTFRMPILWGIDNRNFLPRVKIIPQNFARPASFNHVHPVTWHKIMAIFRSITLFTYPEYQQLSSELYAYFNEKEVWYIPERSTAKIDWRMLVEFVVGLIFISVDIFFMTQMSTGNSLDIHGEDVTYFILALCGFIIGTVLTTRGFIRCNRWTICWGLGTICDKEPARSGERWLKKQPSDSEWNRIQDIEKMYKKNALNTFEKLFEILNQEYDGYVRFSKKEWEMEYPPKSIKIDPEMFFRYKNFKVSITIVADRVPLLDKIKIDYNKFMFETVNNDVEGSNNLVSNLTAFGKKSEHCSNAKTPLLSVNTKL